MNLPELITKRASELVDLLSGTKESFDASTAMNTIRQAAGNIDLSDSSRTMLRNAAIGAGAGGALGMVSSRSGYRSGDTLRGALAGGLLGAGGTATYQAMHGKAPMYDPNAAAQQPSNPPLPVSSGVLDPITSRPISSSLLAATGLQSAYETYHNRFGKGGPLSNPVSTPFRTSMSLPHVPGEKSSIPGIERLKSLLGRNPEYHDNQVAGRIQDNLKGWISSMDEKAFGDQRKALGTIVGNLSPSQLNELATRIRDITADPNNSKAVSNLEAFLSSADGIPAGTGGATADAIRAFSPAKLETYMASRSPLSVRNRRLGALGLLGGAALEPSAWGLASAARAGDSSNQRLTPEQINSINERYFR